MSGIWCLSFHASWRCRHSGACCRAGWTIPIEGAQFDRVVRVRGRRRGPDPLFLTGGPLPEGAAAILGARANGSCIFLDEEDGLCEIHRDLGPHTLPLACRQFPRIVLQDARGTLVTLSHFCPTAAALLVDTARFDVVSAPPAIADDAVDGLDARNVLPPVLRPGLLADPEAYDLWERSAIRVLSDQEGPPWTASETIATATKILDSWAPAVGPLVEAVRRAFELADPAPVAPPDFTTTVERARLAAAAIPQGLSTPPIPADLERVWPEARRIVQRHERAARAFLAARLFGNWMAYSVPGLALIVEYLRISLAVLELEVARQALARSAQHAEQASAGGREAEDEDESRRTIVEALRRADLLLVHLSDYRRLASLIVDHSRRAPQRRQRSPRAAPA